MKNENYFKQWEQISKSLAVLNNSFLNTTSPINNYLRQQQEIINNMSSFNHAIDIAQRFEPIRETVFKLTSFLNTNYFNSIQQSVLHYQSLTVQLADVLKIYDNNYLTFYPESISDRFIDLSDELVNELASEPLLPIDECSDTFDSIKFVTEKRKITIEDIHKVIILILTIWSLLKSYIPDQQITHIENMVQQTIDAGNELIEIKKQELEIEFQQLEEEKKQTQLLEELVEAQPDSTE